MNLKNSRAGSVMSALLAAGAPTASVYTPRQAVAAPVLDSVGTLDAASAYAESDITLKAVSALHEWVETDTLEEGETSADRLMSLFVGIADADQSGELDDDEQDIVNIALNAAFDYLVSKGVDEGDADSLLSDWSPEVADRVRDLLASGMPEGEDATADDIDNFTFGAGDQEPTFDAVYKMKMAIRHGKKMRIKKRISGHIHLSSRQKVAIAKMHRRSHSGVAMMRRMKSARIGRRMGL